MKCGIITFDYKDAPGGDINEVLKIAHDNFSSHSPICAGVALCVTVSHLGDAAFLNKYSQNILNAGVIIDQDDDCDGVLQNFIAAKQTRFGFADGIESAPRLWASSRR